MVVKVLFFPVSMGMHQLHLYLLCRYKCTTKCTGNTTHYKVFRKLATCTNLTYSVRTSQESINYYCQFKVKWMMICPLQCLTSHSIHTLWDSICSDNPQIILHNVTVLYNNLESLEWSVTRSTLSRWSWRGSMWLL